MSAKDAKNLELAVRELTAELKRQRGVDPDASIADKPRRLTETPIQANHDTGGFIPADGQTWLGGGCEIPGYTTGYNSRAMEILRKQLGENNDQA